MRACAVRTLVFWRLRCSRIGAGVLLMSGVPFRGWCELCEVYQAGGSRHRPGAGGVPPLRPAQQDGLGVGSRRERFAPGDDVEAGATVAVGEAAQDAAVTGEDDAQAVAVRIAVTGEGGDLGRASGGNLGHGDQSSWSGSMVKSGPSQSRQARMTSTPSG